MKKIIWIMLLSGMVSQLSAQAKHEIKFSPFSLFSLEMVPSYEIISENEVVGFEIGAGYNFKRASLTTSNDTFPDFFANEFEKYGQQSFKALMSLRFYKSRQVSESGIGVFFGPFARYEQRTFLEDAYLVRQDELIAISPRRLENFVGQREIKIGMFGGFKFLIKTKYVIELGYEIAGVFDENKPGSLEYREAYMEGGFVFKAGYRFGNRPMPSKVVE